MTERELGEAVYLSKEIRRLEALLNAESSETLAGMLVEHKRSLETAKLAILGYICCVPDARVRLIMVMRFLEGRSWESIARELHYERTSPAKILRRWLAENG